MIILPNGVDINNHIDDLRTFSWEAANILIYYSNMLKDPNAKDYIIKNKNITGIKNREIKMISTNFCYGGEEIYEIENLKN